MTAQRRIIVGDDGNEKFSFNDVVGCDSKNVTGGEINLKRFNNKESEAAVPPAMLSSENSMELKMEATRKKLEQRYGEEAEKKGKKKVQVIDFPAGSKGLGGGGRRRRCGFGSKKAIDVSVRERVLASLKRMKGQNEKPKYSVYKKKIVEED